MTASERIALIKRISKRLEADNGTAPPSFAGRRGGNSSTSRENFRGDAERVCRRPRMAVHIRRPSAGHRVSPEGDGRDQPPERRSRRPIYDGCRQRTACTAAIAAAKSQLLRGNSRDRCSSQSAQNPGNRRHNREDRRRAKPDLRPRADGLRRQNSKRPKLRSRLSNALPLSGGRPSAADHPLQRHVSQRFHHDQWR